MLPLRGQSERGSDGSEGVLRIPQSSNITWTSPSDCLKSYPGHLLVVVGPYPYAKVQSVYSTVPADWAFKNYEAMCIAKQLIQKMMIFRRLDFDLDV